MTNKPKDDKILNVPPLRFPEFTEKWAIMKVSDLLSFHSTNSLSWDQLNYENGVLRNLHYGLIHKGMTTLIDSDKIDLPWISPGNEPKKYTKCLNGDVAFADASEDTNDVGKAVEFINNTANQDIVCGLHTIHGRDKKGITVPGFKGYAFNSVSFRNQLRRLAQGTKVFSISPRVFDEIYIGIPSIAEQTKISRLLQLLDERIVTQNKIIENLQSLIKGIIQHLVSDGLAKGTWRKIKLSEVLRENIMLNRAYHPVHSVSVSAGVVNQMEYLGRSFSAKDTAHYHVVEYGDIVYTKSPTGNQPYGIIKQSFSESPAAVSPLYGVYKPKTFEIGNFLHFYFLNSRNTNNYLSPLIQKGAKNTINISNQRFLENTIPLPIKDSETLAISILLSSLKVKMSFEENLLSFLLKQKRFLLCEMFI